MDSCAHLTRLRRTAVAPFPPGHLATLEQVETAPDSLRLLAPDAALPQLPAITLDKALSGRLRQGQTIQPQKADGLAGGLVRLYDPGARFLGIGELQAGTAQVKPVRLFNDLGPPAT
jgi:tRNA U55 pseudouridine synthase TruB